MAGQQDAEYGDQQPVVGPVEGVPQLRPFLSVHVLQAQPNKKRCQGSDKEVLQRDQELFLHTAESYTLFPTTPTAPDQHMVDETHLALEGGDKGDGVFLP